MKPHVKSKARDSLYQIIPCETIRSPLTYTLNWWQGRSNPANQQERSTKHTLWDLGDNWKSSLTSTIKVNENQPLCLAPAHAVDISGLKQAITWCSRNPLAIGVLVQGVQISFYKTKLDIWSDTWSWRKMMASSSKALYPVQPKVNGGIKEQKLSILVQCHTWSYKEEETGQVESIELLHHHAYIS